jgi:hypothetical protein
MKEIENFIDSVLPKASVEDMVVAISILIEECNEDSRQTAIHQMEKEIYMKLQEDAFDSGLIAEVSEMILENPGVDMVTLDKWIRNEWDL